MGNQISYVSRDPSSARAAAWSGACVLAANDEMAAGIIAAGLVSGLAVPKDLPVVGFDDTRISRMVRPALTTVRVPMFDMGAKAVGLLCQRIAEPGGQPTQICLHPELVVRESCGGKGRAPEPT